jgi:CBS domain-containing protein
MKDVMTSFDKLVLGYENDSIRDCQKLMVNNKIRHLPIIAEADRGVFEYITVIILFNISFVNLFFN